MTQSNYTEVLFVVDRSGSMGPIANDIVGSINNFIEEQKKVPGICRVTYTQFNTSFDTPYKSVPVTEFPAITSDLYAPGGMTALLDAVGKGVDDLGAHLANMEEGDRPSKVICVIVTDGQENSSQEYTYEAIKDKVEHQENTYSWEFVYLGAGFDAFDEGHKFGMKGATTMQYAATSGGITHALNTVSAKVTRSRTKGTPTSFDSTDYATADTFIIDSGSTFTNENKDPKNQTAGEIILDEDSKNKTSAESSTNS